MSERTVLVRLKLAIQEYVRDARLAGKEGSTAFDKTSVAAASAGRNVNVLEKNTQKLGKTTTGVSRDVDRLGVSLTRADRNIDRLSGRLKIIVQSAIALGPALVPITTSLLPLLTGLATGLGFAAAGVGAGVFAFQSIGDALKAIEDAKLDPTADNLDKMQIALEKIGPDGEELVRTLGKARPILSDLQNATRAGLFPGVGEGIDDLLKRAPELEDILFKIGKATGGAASRAGGALASGEFDDFFAFIDAEAIPQITKLANTLGYLAKAGTDTFIALDPLSDSFGDGLLEGSKNLAEAASNLDGSSDLREFIDYIETTGPEVVDTFLALANAVLQVGEAAAPLGGPVLDSVEGVANAVAIIADSDLGGPLVAMAVLFSGLARGAAVVSSAKKNFDGLGTSLSSIPAKATKARSSIRLLETTVGGGVGFSDGARKLGKVAAAGAGIGIAMSGVADKVGLTNTAIGASAGLLAGPWGAAAGAGVGLLLDYAAAQSRAREEADAFSQTLDQQSGSFTDASSLNIFSGLKDAGLVDIAQENGIALDTLVDSILQGGPAFDQLRGQFIDIGAASATGTFASTGYKNALDALRGRVVDGQKDQKDTAEALDQTSAGYNGLADAAQRAADSTREFNASLARSNRLLDNRSAARDYQGAIDAVRRSVKDNGRTLDITTEKGRNNQAVLDDIARSALDVADGLSGSNRIAFLRQARADMRDAARKLGATKDRASELSRELLKLDGMVVNVAIRVGISQSGSALYQFGGPGGPKRNKGEALGGFYPGPVATYARGGMDLANRHQPEITDGSTLRVWSEPETRGETYLPHANDDRRPAAKQYLAQTARLFGGEVQWFDRGGYLASGGGTSKRGGGHMTVSGTLQTPWGPAEIAGIASGVARQEIAADAKFNRNHRRGN